MRHHKIRVGDIVTVNTSVTNRPQRVVITDVYREDVEVTGRYYNQVHEFISRPVIEVIARDLQSEEEIFLLHRVVEKMSMFTVLNKIAELKKKEFKFSESDSDDDFVAKLNNYANHRDLISQLSEVVVNKMLGEKS